MKKKSFLLLLSFLMVTSWTAGTTAQAQEGNGGQVQTNGEITFYEDEPTPSESSEPPASSDSSVEPPVSSSSELPVDSSSDVPVKKPGGSYPSTGELVKTSLSVTGGLLIISAFVLFFIRRKKGGAKG